MMTRQWSNDSLISRFRKKILSGVNFKWVGMKNRWRRRSWDFFRFNNWTFAKLSFLLMWFSFFFYIERFKHRRREKTYWGEKYCSATRDKITWSKMKSKTHDTTSSLSLMVLKERIYILVSYQRGVVMNLISFICICWST